MSSHNAELHALRHEVDRLNNTLKERDLEIAALKATQVNANRAAHASVEHQQAEYEGPAEAKALEPAAPREDFTSAADMTPKAHEKHKPAKND